MRTLRIVIFLIFLSACSSSQVYIDEEERERHHAPKPPIEELVYQTFLIGDTGAASADSPVMALLKQHLAEAGEESAVVFLGDNIYPSGLPDSSNIEAREKAEAILQAQFDVVEGFEGKVVFIPGNHDWDFRAEPDGENVKRQEAYVRDHVEQKPGFHPRDGFPGPEDVKLTKDLRLVILDTQWLLAGEGKPFGDTGEYELKEVGDFFEQLNDLLERRRNEDLLIVGHHPLVSNGQHAGFYPLRSHLFPFTDLHPAAYVPLPLVGSLYPLYVRYIGGRQDLGHVQYRAVREMLTQVFSQHERLMYAAGHEHNMQFFRVEGIYEHPHIISGSGSKANHVAKGRGAAFTASQKGFVRLDHYENGTTWMDVIVPDGGDGGVLFSTQIMGPAAERVDPGLPTETDGDFPDYRDSTVVAAIQPDYKPAGPTKAFFVGQHYRKTWSTPVEFEVLDIANEAGGLTPLKRGGGVQSTSVRLEGGDEREYILRSIDKDARRSLEKLLGERRTFGGDIAQDQVSALHPYGAFVVPHLADAVGGVYHTNPRPVYVPEDERLGIYKELIGGHVMLFEERPDDDMSHLPSYGGTKEVISATQMFRSINDDNDHRVDAQAMARARLFDLLIADWDRHEDQWRWASFEPYELDPTLEGDARKDGKIYQPIPRDRDWAFHTMDGLLPTIARFSILPKYQGFREKYGNLQGLTLNGLYQDRRFFSEFTREEWVATGEDIKQSLTDEEIEVAVRTLPEDIFALDGERFIRTLKARRDQLPDVAEEYYELISGIVDVVGSNKHERFEVHRVNDDETEVIVYKTSKDGDIEKELYRRVFHRKETKELRLYGQDGKDRFYLTGDVRKGIQVRVIGGLGKDTYVDSSRVRGAGKKTVFYGSPRDSEMQPGPDTKVVESDKPGINAYDPTGFNYNLTLPLATFGYDKDDGLVLGGGALITLHGFRKKPFASQHSILAQIGTLNQSFAIDYKGQFTRVIRALDLVVDGEIRSPNSIRNFYGLGNETTQDFEDARFYQARIRERLVRPYFRREESGTTIYGGVKLWSVSVKEDADRIIGEPQPGVSESSFGNQLFGGFVFGFGINAVDRPINPRLGFRWLNDLDTNIGLRKVEDNYASISSDLRVYYSPSLSPQVTLALRVGTAHNFGNFPFFGASTLGGRRTLRGYRSNRYAGRTSFYNNVEVRAKLASLANYVILGELGVLGFLDNGRVWTDGESSRVWHQGYGGGVWISVFDIAMLTATMGFSKEDTTFLLKFGFFF